MLLVIAAGVGCAGSPRPEGLDLGFSEGLPFSEPASVDAAPPELPRNWVALSRGGRRALENRRYRQAEANFRQALTALERISPHDARSQSLLGHLVRLASIYERLGRRGGAERVMSLVAEHVSRRQTSRHDMDHYQGFYLDLVEQPLAPIHQPPLKAPVKKGIDGLIARSAYAHKVDPALVKAVVAAESNFDVTAVSHAGAQGLMQLMPKTAQAMGVRAPFNPVDNINGGTRYLRKMLDRYGEITQALAAYNAGPKAVDRHGGIPPYPETKAYVARVLGFYQDYRNHFTR